MPGEDHGQERRVADDGHPALVGQRHAAGDELPGGDADADGHLHVLERGQLLVDGARGADGVQHAALAVEDGDELVPDDLSDLAVLALHLGLLHAHDASERAEQHGGVALPHRRQAAQVGHEHGSFVELRRLGRARRGGAALLRLGRHLLVQLLELGLIAQRGDHLGEGAAQDAHFVVAIDVRMDRVVAGGDRLRHAGELLDGTGHALGDDPGQDERQQQRDAAADEQRVLDLFVRRQLHVERAEEHRRADRPLLGAERLAGHHELAAVDRLAGRRHGLAGVDDLLHAGHLLHADRRCIRRARQ